MPGKRKIKKQREESWKKASWGPLKVWGPRASIWCMYISIWIHWHYSLYSPVGKRNRPTRAMLMTRSLGLTKSVQGLILSYSCQVSIFFSPGDVTGQFTAAPPTCPGEPFTFRCTVVALVECFGPAFSRDAGNLVGKSTIQTIGQ